MNEHEWSAHEIQKLIQFKSWGSPNDFFPHLKHASRPRPSACNILCSYFHVIKQSAVMNATWMDLRCSVKSTVAACHIENTFCLHTVVFLPSLYRSLSLSSSHNLIWSVMVGGRTGDWKRVWGSVQWLYEFSTKTPSLQYDFFILYLFEHDRMSSGSEKVNNLLEQTKPSRAVVRSQT